MTHLDRFLEKFRVDGDTAMAAAKTWACLEAVYKAEAGSHLLNDVRIIFPKNQPPQVVEDRPVLRYQYILSLTHEGDLVVAVALGQPK